MAINSAIPELHPAVVKMNYTLLEAKSKPWKWPMSRMCSSFSPIFLYFKLKIFSSGKEKKKIPFDHTVPTACHSSALGGSERYIYQMNFLTGIRNPALNSWMYHLLFFFFCPLKRCYYCWHFRTPKEQDTAVPSGGEAWLNEAELRRAGGNSEDHLVHPHTTRQDHLCLCLPFLTGSSNVFWKPFSDRDFTVSSDNLYHSCFPIHPGQKRLLFPSVLQQPFTTWRPLCCHSSAISFLVKETELNQSFFAGAVF